MNPVNYSKFYGAWRHTYTRQGEKSQPVYLFLSYEQNTYREFHQNGEVHQKLYRALSILNIVNQSSDG